MVAAGSGVGTNVPADAFVSGYPALPHQRQIEQQLYLGRQKRLHDKVAGIASRLDAMEKAVKK